ncbi:MAG: DUF2461 domain-containing protein [Candidatus Marinarcus sp.]|uniref:DUF2461 domain-containing protein n=1 Tax=Candidatus Marinarcus sp. TaxID=3100987 RepID=UPI003B002411
MLFNGFTQEGLDFLDQIKTNNNKVWFEDHRHIWEETILKPNIAYVNEMGEHLIALAPMIKAVPKVSGSLFKIYRDVRFSNDKTPIKTRIGIMFWQGSTHRMQSASFYMHYTSSEVFVATGIRTFKPPLLKKYREYIQIEKNAKALHEILEKLKQKKIEIIEPHFKRYPVGFDETNPYAYLSLFNAMYAYTTFKPNKTFLSKNIINKNFKFYDETLELFHWLYELTLYSKD